MKTVAFLLCLLAPCAAFVAKAPSRTLSSAMAASRTENVVESLGRFATAAALSLVILANPAPSLADGKLIGVSCKEPHTLGALFMQYCSVACAITPSLIILHVCLSITNNIGQTKDFKLPPIDYADKTRCVLNSSSMGQANAARDKLYDLRECKLSGQDASGYDLSGVIMTNTDVSNAKFKESQFSKAYLHGE